MKGIGIITEPLPPKRDARGRLIRRSSSGSLSLPSHFDQRYEGPYRRLVLEAVKHLLDGRTSKKYKSKVAPIWREALERDAPLLRGFLAAEPQFQPKLIAWLAKMNLPVVPKGTS